MFISKNHIEIEKINFIRVTLKDIKKAVNNGKNNNPDYMRFISFIMLTLGTQKYDVYLVVPSYPKIFYSLFRKTIINDCIQKQFEGIYIGWSVGTKSWLSQNSHLYRKEINGFTFYDFSYLNFNQVEQEIRELQKSKER